MSAGAIILGGVALANIGLQIADSFGAFGGGDAGESGGIEIGPEAEASMFEAFGQQLDAFDAQIQQAKDLIPLLEARASDINKFAQGITPSASAIQDINRIDQEIADRFGVDIQKDVQTGIITDKAKRATIDLQDALAEELRTQGKIVDDKVMSDIMERVRTRISAGGAEEKALDEIRNGLLAEFRKTGEAIPETDPLVERKLKEGEAALRSQLLNQLGPDYENTSAGRRALRDFQAGATETRFETARGLRKEAAELGALKVRRLGDLARGVTGAIEARDIGLLRAGQAALTSQAIGAGRIQRITDLIGGQQAAVKTAILAGEPERLRQQLNIQRAGVSLAAGAQLRRGAEFGFGAQLKGLEALQLPLGVRASITATNRARLASFADFGKFKLSKEGTEAIRQGFGPFQARREIFGGQLRTAEDIRDVGRMEKAFGRQEAVNLLTRRFKRETDIRRRRRLAKEGPKKLPTSPRLPGEVRGQ